MGLFFTAGLSKRETTDAIKDAYYEIKKEEALEHAKKDAEMRIKKAEQEFDEAFGEFLKNGENFSF